MLEEREKQVKREGLPELKNAEKVRLFCDLPQVNGPLSFRHARGIIINGGICQKNTTANLF
ncbi:MAG: hypothetical protein CM15mP47_5220 [Methanobacteriota archaeon]|nr:MAG: hypothetical protein CM15mP47_5220 [Euryarchaeota archaeon]